MTGISNAEPFEAPDPEAAVDAGEPLAAPRLRDRGVPKVATLDTYTAADLQHMKFPPIPYLVPGILTPGLYHLAGPPKIGKSWLILGVLIALATGGRAFGSIKVEPTGVLYLALEDNKRRLQNRLNALYPDADSWPPTLHMHNEAPRLDAGLIPALEAWLDAHPTCEVVAIDTLAKVRGRRAPSEDMYTSDSMTIEPLQALAQRRELCIILVHHVRKMPGVDIFETISGTYGLTGPADGLLVLERVRGEADAKLHITGRDIEEQAQDDALALRFDKTTFSWQLMGNAATYAQSTERRRIIETLSETPGLTPKEIADVAGLKHASVKHLCIRLREEGAVTSDTKGRYSAASEHPKGNNRSPRSPDGDSADEHGTNTVNGIGERPQVARSPFTAPGERVNDGERPPFTATNPTSTGQSANSERGERSLHLTHSPPTIDDLKVAAVRLWPTVSEASADVLRAQLDDLLATLPVVPAMWPMAATSTSGLYRVTLASAIYRDAIASGATIPPSQAFLFLQAADHAIAASEKEHQA